MRPALPLSHTVFSGKLLSRIILGTHTFGEGGPSEKKDFRMMDMYVAAGGNVIDTAACYGDGKSERCIGRWMQARNNRANLVISTKCGQPEFQNGIFQRHRLSYAEMKADLENSLVNLQTDYIDVYFLHKDDPSVPVGEIMEFLNEHIKKGVIRHIGASNWRLDRICAANRYAEERGLQKLEVSQLAFSLRRGTTRGWGANERVLEMDATEYARYLKNKLPVFAFNTQAYGYFYKNMELPENEQTGTPEDKEILKRLKVVCRKKGWNVQKTLFAAYMACRLNVFPIIRASTETHFSQLLQSFDGCCSVEEADYIFGNRFEQEGEVLTHE